MQITIIQGAFLPVPPVCGGAVERIWYQLGQQFAHMGHSVVHISRSYPGLSANEMLNGVNHHRVQGFDMPANILLLKYRDLRYSLRVVRDLPDADILITNTFWLPLLISQMSLRPGRTVVSVERMPKGQMFMYRNVSSFRCCTTAVRDCILREQPQFASRAVVIPNPIPFRLDPIHPIPEKSPVILFVGRIHPEKGIDLLLRSFVRACELGLRGWTLRIVGPHHVIQGGAGTNWITKLKQLPLGIMHMVDWVGPIFDESRLQEEYRRASIFVYPSLADRGEAFGLAPLEAMAHASVPIVSSLPCFTDFIINGHNGLIFNHRSPDAVSLLSDYLLQLTSEPLLLRTLSLNAFAVRHSHHPRTIANQMIAHFESLMTV